MADCERVTHNMITNVCQFKGGKQPKQLKQSDGVWTVHKNCSPVPPHNMKKRSLEHEDFGKSRKKRQASYDEYDEYDDDDDYESNGGNSDYTLDLDELKRIKLSKKPNRDYGRGNNFFNPYVDNSRKPRKKTFPVVSREDYQNYPDEYSDEYISDNYSQDSDPADGDNDDYYGDGTPRPDSNYADSEGGNSAGGDNSYPDSGGNSQYSDSTGDNDDGTSRQDSDYSDSEGSNSGGDNSYSDEEDDYDDYGSEDYGNDYNAKPDTFVRKKKKELKGRPAVGLGQGKQPKKQQQIAPKANQTRTLRKLRPANQQKLSLDEKKTSSGK